MLDFEHLFTATVTSHMAHIREVDGWEVGWIGDGVGGGQPEVGYTFHQTTGSM